MLNRQIRDTPQQEAGTHGLSMRRLSLGKWGKLPYSTSTDTVPSQNASSSKRTLLRGD